MSQSDFSWQKNLDGESLNAMYTGYVSPSSMSREGIVTKAGEVSRIFSVCSVARKSASMPLSPSCKLTSHFWGFSCLTKETSSSLPITRPENTDTFSSVKVLSSILAKEHSIACTGVSRNLGCSSNT